MSAGTLLVAWWLCSLAAGSASYHTFSAAARYPLGQIVLFGFAWALAYHLANGIRHLAWDAGLGFNVRTANRSGVAVAGLSLLLTVAVFAYAYWTKGLQP